VGLEGIQWKLVDRCFCLKNEKKLTVCDAINECEPLPLVFDEVELM